MFSVGVMASVLVFGVSYSLCLIRWFCLTRQASQASGNDMRFPARAALWRSKVATIKRVTWSARWLSP
mgnify:CR=1 FL=1